MTIHNSASITVFSWVLALLTLGTGLFIKEIILTLTALFTLFILSWSLLSVYLLRQIYKNEAKKLFCTITPTDGHTGTQLQVQLSGLAIPSVFRLSLPGIVTFYELVLKTADGKILSATIPLSSADLSTKHLSAKGLSVTLETDAASRGVYYTESSRLALRDIFGFYTLTIPIPYPETESLILRPKPANDGIHLILHSGGSTRREDQRYQRTEDLTEHRPYVPGDDPRRINWKLFGHSGDLFIRQAEQEPPPLAEYVLVLDTSVDYRLFSQEEGQILVDSLCEQGLAVAFELAQRKYSITLSYPGSGIYTPDANSISKALAYPAAISLLSNRYVPDLPHTASILILAIPRILPAADSALDTLLAKPHQWTHLHFINPAKVLNQNRYQNTYEACIRYYGQIHET